MTWIESSKRESHCLILFRFHWLISMKNCVLDTVLWLNLLTQTRRDAFYTETFMPRVILIVMYSFKIHESDFSGKRVHAKVVSKLGLLKVCAFEQRRRWPEMSETNYTTMKTTRESNGFFDDRDNDNDDSFWRCDGTFHAMASIFDHGSSSEVLSLLLLFWGRRLCKHDFVSHHFVWLTPQNGSSRAENRE